MKIDIIKQFNLPAYLKDKSFSDASKAIENKFKDRLDTSSLNTKKELLQRLANAQEFIKAKEQEALNPTPDPMVDQNQAFLGGLFGNKTANSSSPDIGAEAAEKAGGIGANINPMGLATGALGMVNNMSGKNSTGSTGADIGSGALQGASAGMSFGPWGAAIGGVLGGVTGLIGSNKAKKKQEELDARNALSSNLQHRGTDFAMGGKMNSYANGGPTDPIMGPHAPNDFEFTNLEQYNLDPNSLKPMDQFPYAIPGYNEYSTFDDKPFFPNIPYASGEELRRPPNGPDTPSSMPNRASLIAKAGSTPRKLATPAISYETKGLDSDIFNNDFRGTSTLTERTPDGPQANLWDKLRAGANEVSGEAGDFIKDNYADALRYSPVIANALQLRNLEKPEYERLDRLDNRYDPDYVDENSLTNRVSQASANARRGLHEASGGDLGALRASLIGSQLNEARALSDAYLQAENINRGENRAGQEFNLNVDRTNLQQSTMENEINARNEGVYDSNKSALIGQIGQDLGNIGREQRFKQMVEQSGICYDTRGAYVCGDTNQRLSQEDLTKINDSKKKTNENRYGGNIDSNSLFTNYLDVVMKNKKNK